MKKAGIVLAIYAWIIWMAIPVFAHDMEHPEWAEWYQSLMQPDVPTVSCCGEADGYYADDVHVHDGKTYATITDDRVVPGRPQIDLGTVIEIPDNKLKWDRGNPTGHSIVFLSRAGYVFCFVQGTGI